MPNIPKGMEGVLHILVYLENVFRVETDVVEEQNL